MTCAARRLATRWRNGQRVACVAVAASACLRAPAPAPGPLRPPDASRCGSTQGRYALHALGPDGQPVGAALGQETFVKTTTCVDTRPLGIRVAHQRVQTMSGTRTSSWSVTELDAAMALVRLSAIRHAPDETATSVARLTPTGGLQMITGFSGTRLQERITSAKRPPISLADDSLVQFSVFCAMPLRGEVKAFPGMIARVSEHSRENDVIRLTVSIDDEVELTLFCMGPVMQRLVDHTQHLVAILLPA